MHESKNCSKGIDKHINLEENLIYKNKVDLKNGDRSLLDGQHLCRLYFQEKLLISKGKT